MNFFNYFVAAWLLLTTLSFIACDSHTKPYKDGEEVIIWVNHVGPFHNPQETYLYYSLPYCEPAEVIETHAEGLGEALQGYELRKSALSAAFKEDIVKKDICTKTLAVEEAEKFRHAIENQYWYQIFIDDLPIWGMVGERLKDPSSPSSKDQMYVYTHMKFTITYNGDRVIEVNLASEAPIEVKANEPITFTYSIQWYPTDVPYELRFEKYLDDNFFEHQIHWFSIFNSFMMVIFLVGLVSMILLRALRKDYARFNRERDLEEDDDAMADEQHGWKHVHGDVFRPPKRLVLFAALIGTGYQLAILVFFVIFFAILGTYYVHRGTLVTSFVFCYALTSFVAGYAGGGYYARNGGQLWIKNMLIIAGLFPGLIVVIALALDVVAVAYGSLASIPIGTMIAVVCIWLFIAFPLTVVGTIIGKNYDGRASNPCRTNPVPRPIPQREWYLGRWVHVVLGGVLPFGSVFIELYFIMTAFYSYKVYYVFGFLLLVYAILLIVTVCTTVVSTYLLLNAEDHRWQWTAFLSGASTGVYVFLYAVYFFIFKTHQTGLLQISFFFGYAAMACVGLSILCGAVGFIGASVLVHAIFKEVKSD